MLKALEVYDGPSEGVQSFIFRDHGWLPQFGEMPNGTKLSGMPQLTRAKLKPPCGTSA